MRLAEFTWPSQELKMVRRGWRRLAAVMTVMAAAGVVMGAEPQEEVRAAVKKLADGGNYSWVALTTDGDSATGAAEGMTDKGTTLYSVVQFQATSPAVEQGGKLVVKMDDGTWKTAAEVAQIAADARAAQMAARQAAATQEFQAEEVPRYEPILYSSLQVLGLPTGEMMGVAQRLKEVKKEGDVYTGELTAEVAADLLMNRRPVAGPATASAPMSMPRGIVRGTGPASGPASAPASAPGMRRRPEPTGTKGTAKFKVKNGVVVKYEVKVSGTFVFGGQERVQEREYGVEIKDVGTTKVVVPEGARSVIR
jgi:hypothetical protein